MRLLIALGVVLCACNPTPAAPAIPSAAASAQPSEPAAASPGSIAIAGRALPFERIGRAPSGGVSPISGRTTSAPTMLVAGSQEELDSIFTNQRLATHVTGMPRLPDGSAYLAGFAGVKPSSGYAFAVTDLRAVPGAVVVWVTQARPAPADVVLTVLTYPVDVVRIAASELARGTRLELRDATSGALLARAAYCGSTRQANPLTPYDPTGPACVWDAYSRGETAQWLYRGLTIEGGPIIRTLRAVPGGTSEVSRDDRGDGFAHAPGVRSWACAQVARSSVQTTSGGTFVWFELTVCTGDGVIASVP